MLTFDQTTLQEMTRAPSALPSWMPAEPTPRSYSYSIIEAPFPIADYLATISVNQKAGGSGCLVDWSATFIAKGVSDSEVSKLFQGIFEDGLKALAARSPPSRRVSLPGAAKH